uniref:Peptidase S1 domain-containing protein n=1 Tax=Callorhinchus milii TaxID=7868 RepID=A0A4W3KJ95_CALMI
MPEPQYYKAYVDILVLRFWKRKWNSAKPRAFFSLYADCGNLPRLNSRIIGGHETQISNWPWLVSLHFHSFGHVCAATVINRKWLLSAAHCYQDTYKAKYSDITMWKAIFGIDSQYLSTSAVTQTIKRLIQHEQYDDTTLNYDITLLELSAPIAFNENIQPVCLPSSSHVFPAGKSCHIVGWGAKQENGECPISLHLQVATVKIIDQALCNKRMKHQITTQMLCAGYLTGEIDACDGDSGGPLLCEESSGKWFVAGVVSAGEGCARSGLAGIYTRLAKFYNWILQQYPNSHSGVPKLWSLPTCA